MTSLLIILLVLGVLGWVLIKVGNQLLEKLVTKIINIRGGKE